RLATTAWPASRIPAAMGQILRRWTDCQTTTPETFGIRQGTKTCLGMQCNESSARAALDSINVRAQSGTGEYMHATTEIIDGKPNASQQQGVRAKQRCA